MAHEAAVYGDIVRNSMTRDINDYKSHEEFLLHVTTNNGYSH